MTELQLLAAHLAGGLERVSWFNGRVLTAEDMSDHQRAVDAADHRLGRALGPGVARGLRVTRQPDGRSVTVTEGLAVDPAGEVLELTTDVTVHLVRPAEASPAAPADFVCCDTVPTGARLAGTGAYLLTIASATGTRGGAVGVDPAGASACGPRYDVAGVQFRLVEIDVAELAADGGHGPADLAVLATLPTATRHPRLRNVLAHVLLDSVARRREVLDPFSPLHTPALGRLAEAALVGCEVPLALVVWAAGRIEFVDVWAARRPPAPDAPATWPSRFVGPAAAGAGLATLLQAADHLRDLVGPDSPPADRITVRASRTFRYLPAALLVPHTGPGGTQGVDLAVFFTGLDVRGEPPVAAGRVWPLLTAALTAPVIDLDGGGVLRSYRVAEAVAAGAGQPYVLLAADHLRHLALAPPEDDDRPVITAVSPPGDHQIGAEITVHGRGFLLPSPRNVVTVGGIPVTEFRPGSSATALVLDVPPVPGVPRAAALTVTNENGSAEWLLSVVPRRDVPRGKIVMLEDFGDVAQQPLEENQKVTFYWQATAATDRSSTYVFTPVLTASTGVPASQWEATVVDAERRAREEFELGPDGTDPVAVGVRVVVPPRARAAQLQLRCTAPAAPADPALNRTTPVVVLVVGKATETSDPRVVFGDPVLTGGGSVSDDGVLAIPPGRPVRVAVVAHFKEGATASWRAGLESASPASWTLSNPDPPPSRTTTETAGGERPFTMPLVAGRSAAVATLRLQVDAIAAHSGEAYTSFVRLRLRAS
jgi:hypothetical protein